MLDIIHTLHHTQHMKLKKYLSTLERGGATRFAKSVGISKSYLSQLAAGAAISPARAVQFEKESDYKVTRKDLRPKDWHKIWPDLVEK